MPVSKPPRRKYDQQAFVRNLEQNRNAAATARRTFGHAEMNLPVTERAMKEGKLGVLGSLGFATIEHGLQQSGRKYANGFAPSITRSKPVRRGLSTRAKVGIGGGAGAVGGGGLYGVHRHRAASREVAKGVKWIDKPGFDASGGKKGAMARAKVLARPTEGTAVAATERRAIRAIRKSAMPVTNVRRIKTLVPTGHNTMAGMTQHVSHDASPRDGRLRHIRKALAPAKGVSEFDRLYESAMGHAKGLGDRLKAAEHRSADGWSHAADESDRADRWQSRAGRYTDEYLRADKGRKRAIQIGAGSTVAAGAGGYAAGRHGRVKKSYDDTAFHHAKGSARTGLDSMRTWAKGTPPSLGPRAAIGIGHGKRSSHQEGTLGKYQSEGSHGRRIR